MTPVLKPTVLKAILALPVILFLTFMALPGRPYSQVITGAITGARERFQIAVSPLKELRPGKDDAKLSEGIADNIVHDLILSGWFRVLDRSAYIENPQSSGITLGNFNFRNWSTLGAQGLLKGGFSIEGDELTVEFRLFDVYQEKQLVGKKYTAKVKDFRRIAHKFADEIIAQYTGEPGPFSSRIAYVSTGAGRFKEIYVAHLDGSERTQITNNRTINLSPAWSPDGRSLLYTSYKEGNSNLYLLDLIAGKETRISSRTGSSVGGKLSPDGQLIAVSLERSGNTDIYLLERSGNVVRRLTEDSGIDVSPAWSPDGTQLAFVSNRSGSPQLYLVEIAGGKARRLTYSGSYNTSPDWSPKGDKIAYTGRTGGFNIFTIGPQGGEPQQLTSGSRNNEDPSWSPDGRFIAFTSNRNGRYQLYLMQANGENQQRLTGTGGDDTNPSWSPRVE